jgi:hypothetical protein
MTMPIIKSVKHAREIMDTATDAEIAQHGAIIEAIEQRRPWTSTPRLQLLSMAKLIDDMADDLDALKAVVRCLPEAEKREAKGYIRKGAVKLARDGAAIGPRMADLINIGRLAWLQNEVFPSMPNLQTVTVTG